MRRRLLPLLLGLCTLLAVPIPRLKAQTFHPDYLDGHIYLKLQDSTTINLDPYPGNLPALNLILTTFGVDSLYRPFKSGHPALQNIYRLEFLSILGVDNLINQLELLNFVDYAEKVPLIKAIGSEVLIPNDLQGSQWNLTKIQADLAWSVTLGNSNIKVAVVDNAIRRTHEDLLPIIWENAAEANGLPLLDDDFNGFTDDAYGYDVADMDNNVNPPSGQPGWDHGSHCSGVAGAATDNGLGIASIGYGISIIPVKASNDATGPNTMSKAYEGVDYARSVGADVINMSWGSHGISATAELILSLAAGEGILLVAAAGNLGDSVLFYPAAYPICFAVGSTDQNDIKSPFSNYGSYVDIMAPGSDIPSCYGGNDSEYGILSGTSMASPLTAGLAGLLWSAAPTLTDVQIRTMIEDGAVDIYPLNPNYIGQLGAGRINAYNSMLLAGIDDPGATTSGLMLYPNPANGKITFRLPESWAHEAVEVTAFDMAGALKQQVRVGALESSLDCEGWAAGTYLLRFSQGEHLATQLLVVQ
jgi:serine protease